MAPVAQNPIPRPADYPAGMARLLRLPSGEQLWIRPVVPLDASALAAEFAAADAATVHARFFNASFTLTGERLRYLTEIDYVSHLALVVMTPEGPASRGVAIGRYAPRHATEVEAAVVVKPEFRGRGVAGILLDELIGAAAAAGYESIAASYLLDNAAAAKLVAGREFVATRSADGIVDVTRSLVADSAGVGSV